MGRETLRVGGVPGSLARMGAGMVTSAWEKLLC